MIFKSTFDISAACLLITTYNNKSSRPYEQSLLCERIFPILNPGPDIISKICQWAPYTISGWTDSDALAKNSDLIKLSVG